MSKAIRVSMLAGSRGRRRCAAMAAVMLLAVAGCVGATPSASPSASRGSASQIPTAVPTTAPTYDLSQVQPVPTIAPTYDLSKVPQAPAGDWKSINWIEVPPPTVAALPSPQPAPSIGITSSSFKVAGWSGGFLGFSVQVVAAVDARGYTLYGPGVATLGVTYSKDGVHWNDGNVVQQPIADPWVTISGVFEGPDGLLAVGESGACATSWIDALWTSPDGVSWHNVDFKNAFGSVTIHGVSGGSSGFVATDATGNHVWTSRDGQSWRPVDFGAPVFAGSRIDDGTAFSGGFVLGGSTEALGPRSCATYVVDPSASPTPAPPMRSPAVWWSADGGNWTKAELPGGTDAYAVSMRICRANDHTLLAYEDYWSDQTYGSGLWTSNDGRIWKSLVWPSSLDPSQILTDGRHGVLVTDPTVLAGGTYVRDAGAGLSTSMVTDDGGLVTLAQDGDQPAYDYSEQWAMGPTGILWMDPASQSGVVRVWIGLPS